MTRPIPTLETERLILRAPEGKDFDALCDFMGGPRSAYIGGPLDPVQAWGMLTSTAGQWQFRGYGNWHITLKGDDAYIGFAGLFHPFDWPEPELGYGVIAEHEGKGLAFEAAMAARKAALGLFGFDALPSYIAAANTRSQDLAMRMKATYEKDITVRGKTARVYRHPSPEAA